MHNRAFPEGRRSPNAGRPSGLTSATWGRAAPTGVLLLQTQVGNRAAAVHLLPGRTGSVQRLAGRPVVQRASALQAFNGVLREIAAELHGSRLAGVLQEIAGHAKLDPDNAEQNIAFREVWSEGPEVMATAETGRRMKERLVQSGFYGIGDALKSRRLQDDQARHLGVVVPPEHQVIAQAFQQALFFRAERQDSNGLGRGLLEFDPSKHGRNGSAREMPGVLGEDVRARADKNLFLTRGLKELKEYVSKAQGGTREVLNIVASRDEVLAMKYDVDSDGYKTNQPLTGIVVASMTQKAKENLATWLPRGFPVDDPQVDAVLALFLRR